MDVRSESSVQSAIGMKGLNMKESVVPRSTINRVTDKDALPYLWMCRFVLLCQKYIGEGALYQLNLAYAVGARVENFLFRIEKMRRVSAATSVYRRKSRAGSKVLGKDGGDGDDEDDKNDGGREEGPQTAVSILGIASILSEEKDDDDFYAMADEAKLKQECYKVVIYILKGCVMLLKQSFVRFDEDNASYAKFYSIVAS